MKKSCIFLSLVFFIALSIPVYGKQDSAVPGKYQDWNRTVDNLEILQAFKVSDYSKIIIWPLDTSKVSLPDIRDNTYTPVKNVLSRINTIFIKGLKEAFENKLNVAPLEKANENSPEILKTNVLMIKARVTEMNPGSFALRFWIRFGAGKTRVEMEGEILDANTETTLLKFKHARVSARGIAFYERVLTRDAMDVSEDIGKMLMNF
jgi:hypothetical protein